MAFFREAREALLLTYDQHDLNTSKNSGYPYWNYDRFDLDNQTDDKCKTDLRFYKSDVYRLANMLNISE